MKNDSLNGTLVLVIEDAGNALSTQHGKIGILTYARSATENYVSFPNTGEAFYRADQVLMLMNKNDVFNDLTKNGSAMPLNDFKAMYKIMLLQDKGTATALHHALEIVRDHPSVRERATEPIGRKQKLEMAKAYSR